jgi:hypothetical protein
MVVGMREREEFSVERYEEVRELPTVLLVRELPTVLEIITT